ncbi:MAG: helix-turn-helix domain-containing protein, partial [Alphaproteobacteria bacterium]
GLPILAGDEAVAPGEALQDLASQVANFERSVLEKELHLAQGDLKQVMERLGLPRKTLADKLARYNLRRG